MQGGWALSISEDGESNTGSIQVDSQKIVLVLNSANTGKKVKTYAYDPNTGKGDFKELDCVRTADRYEITLLISADGAQMTGNIQKVTQNEGSECKSNGLSTELKTKGGATITAKRTATKSSSFGDYGGIWKVSADSEQCELQVVDKAFSLVCDGYGLSGSGSSAAVSAQDTNGIQFAAQHN